MHPRIRIIRHEAVPKTGSFEVRFADGRPSKFFYWDDVLGRWLRPDIRTSAEALEQAKAFVRVFLLGCSPPPDNDTQWRVLHERRPS